MLEPERRERMDGVGKDVEPLFHHHPAKEGDDHLIVGDADVSGATPCRVVLD